MKQLKYFISGIIFYIVAIPIIESLTESAITALELLKGKISIPVFKINKEITELQADLEKTDDAVCMGFDITSSEDYYDDDDFDDKKKNKKTHKI